MVFDIRKAKFTLVGGRPTIGYTKTLTFIGLKVCGHAETEEEIKKLWDQHYEACGGLLLVLDEYGCECQPHTIYM